jgi:orotidine-5'-phosphate decarboxylase
LDPFYLDIMNSFKKRAEKARNPVARELFLLMDRKSTNLAVAIDVIHTRELLEWADLLGPYICLLKVNLQTRGEFL